MTDVEFAQMLARKHALKLEIKGLKNRGRSVYSIIKEKHNLRGNRQSVYTQYCELIEKMRPYVDNTPA